VSFVFRTQQLQAEPCLQAAAFEQRQGACVFCVKRIQQLQAEQALRAAVAWHHLCVCVCVCVYVCMNVQVLVPFQLAGQICSGWLKV
jgi:hypothetical protein